MKLKSLVFACCFSLFSSAFAANHHAHSETNNNDNKAAKSTMWPGNCEIVIMNNSYDNVRVFGTFEDGTSLEPFNVFRYESPHTISLYYRDPGSIFSRCHNGMTLYIDTFSGYQIYSGYTYTDSTVNLVPYLANQSKAQISHK